MDKFLRYSPLILMASIIILAIGLSNNYEKPVVTMSRENYEIQTRTIDSLQSVIYSMQGEHEMRNKIRDEEVENLKILVGKYEFGLSGLDKANRKEFIRYAMFSEDYSEKVNEDYFEENRKLKQKAGYAVSK